jgi:hypothetical protein
MISLRSALPRPHRARRRRILAWLVAPMLLLAAVPASSAAATLYVDENNSSCTDSGSGTATRPFCRIGAAASRTTAGTIVQVKAGTYVEEVAVRSGAAGNPVIFEAAPGEEVTVTGPDHGFYASGRSWVTIRGFRVANTAGDGFHVSSGANNIKVIGNRVISAGRRTGATRPQGSRSRTHRTSWSRTTSSRTTRATASTS